MDQKTANKNQRHHTSRTAKTARTATSSRSSLIFATKKNPVDEVQCALVQYAVQRAGFHL